MRQKRDWVEQGRLIPLVQMALNKHANLPNVPVITELARDDRERKMITALFAPETMVRPFAAPPGVPKACVAALRKAFDDTMKDPAFLVYAKKVKLELNPISGVGAQKIVRDVLGTLPDIVAALKVVLSTKGNVEKVKLSYVSVTGPIVKIKKKGRRLTHQNLRRWQEGQVQGIKMGMNCTFPISAPARNRK